MSIPVNKLGWMAGIIDTRGRLIFKENKSRNTPQVVLAAESKELAIIRALSEMTGTKPELQAPKPLKDFMRRNCSEHCPDAHVHVNDDREMPRVGRWTITGAGMVTVLDNLLPFLVVDRGYEDAIEMVRADTTVVGQGSGAVRASLMRLRDLGWELSDKYAAAIEDVG
jgi:hypothetical protein